MHLNEHTLQTKPIYRGRIFQVEQALVLLPNGQKAYRDVVKHPGAVAILACPKPGYVVLVRQFRYATGGQLWEIPAGKLEPDEKPATCALRELVEETGFYPRRLKHVYSFYTSPGFTSEILALYYADDLERVQGRTDIDEFITTTTIRLREAILWLEQGKIRDAKTIIALQWAASKGLA
ncbi:MAG: NUDIX hydrolase [Firmicutes bacterium]|nr:NUDIX hydrolase [Bacillota bacterium]